MKQGAFDMRNAVILLGIIITSVATIYFATEFISRISEWGRVIGLGLITTLLVALGRHFETADESTEVLDSSGWRWLRVTTAFYFLGLLAALTGVIVFVGMRALDPIVKALAALGLGVGLILFAASRFKRAS